MAAPEQTDFPSLGEVFGDNTQTIEDFLAAASDVAVARGALEAARVRYRESIDGFRSPKLPEDSVIAKRLGADCLVTISNGPTEAVGGVHPYRTAVRLDGRAEGKYFIGSTILPVLTENRASYRIVNLHPGKPLVRVSGLDTAGHVSDAPYELLVDRASLGSLVVARLADIPTEQRYWPFGSSA